MNNPLASLRKVIESRKCNPKVSSDFKGGTVKILTEKGVYVLDSRASIFEVNDSVLVVKSAHDTVITSIEMDSPEKSKRLLKLIYAKKQSLLFKLFKFALYLVAFSFVWTMLFGPAKNADEQGMLTPYEFGKELDFSPQTPSVPKDEGGHDEYGLPTAPFSD